MAYQGLVASIVKCLKQILEKDDLGIDSKESLEVSIQCLESSYDIKASEDYENFDILELYKAHKNEAEIDSTLTPSELKIEAEKLKNQGNTLMKMEKFNDALKCYSKAIEMDNRNAIFYCNRAAVYSKIGNHHSAIKDCEAALSIDPTYSKAYGRLGLAYSNLNDFKKSKEFYEKALELEPDNESFKNNLQITLEKLEQDKFYTENPNSSVSGGNIDFNAFLSNPALRNMARQMLSDPTMQNMMSSLISNEHHDNNGRMTALIEV
ncbi:unnamed protein product [Trichogramma brassicae]|uniref:SGTA homodimerisation domain-containing protein n=1 Tax=Trichogramma brassicae TaxID=86971 RepID=A0A6H5ICF3_9HYME|nr:unnamed protein product [Trichogramma brassicae]